MGCKYNGQQFILVYDAEREGLGFIVLGSKNAQLYSNMIRGLPNRMQYHNSSVNLHNYNLNSQPFAMFLEESTKADDFATGEAQVNPIVDNGLMVCHVEFDIKDGGVKTEKCKK